MGFWHTGYREFHEETGLSEEWVPAKKYWHCSECAQFFEDLEELRQHRQESHPIKRPSLFLDGWEMGAQRVRITRPIRPSQLIVEDAKRIFVNDIYADADSLLKLLSEANRDLYVIRLENGPITSEFQFEFEIALESDLLGVEASLRAMASRGRLDSRSIEEFIHEAGPFDTARGYYDGISAYLYGILAKERAPEPLLPFEVYPAKFQHAQDVLSRYDRPLARLMCTLVAFQFNHFDLAARRYPASRIGLASSRFSQILRREPLAEPACETRGIADGFLTDHDTDRLLEWASLSPSALLSNFAAIETFHERDLSDFDRVKALLLLTFIKARNGMDTQLRDWARQLRNSPLTSRYAQTLLGVD